MEDKIIVSKKFLDNLPITIGINEFGNFLVQHSNGKSGLLKFEDKFGVLRLLEIDFFEFKNSIDKLITDFKVERPNVSAVDEFPYNEIVIEALHSERDYWIKLAFNWLKLIGIADFLDDILAVVNNKNISQELRHGILKL